MVNKSQKRMKEELKREIDRNKCYDYKVVNPAGRQEIFITISCKKWKEY